MNSVYIDSSGYILLSIHGKRGTDRENVLYSCIGSIDSKDRVGRRTDL